MYRTIEKIRSDIANLQAEDRALNARIDELIHEIKNKEQSNEEGNQMTMTPREQKKYEKKLLKARERFRESARELIRLYGQNPEACEFMIDGMMLPGAGGIRGTWTVLLGPSFVMTRKATETAVTLREAALNQLKQALGIAKFEEAKNVIKEMLGDRQEAQKDKEQQ
ncbi:MAG: hypothetical protein IKE69_07995 [Thermoguttaceae bacterium]|nr:hypothetical protein [Thermoguttaceae bacterium]